MPTLKVINTENQPVDEVNLSEKVFGLKVNQHLLWEAVKSYLANQRRGTASTKTRAEVSGGGAKPWKQKGTGRARAGSNRSPLLYKGGVVFGPKPRDYSWALPKKMKAKAICTALSAKVADEKVLILDELTLSEVKTKAMLAILKKLDLISKTTLLIEKPERNINLSGRNLKKLQMLNLDNINTYDLLNCDKVVITRAAVNKLEEKFGK